MTTIWKYQFEIDGRISVQMPVGAAILHVDVQDGVPTMWALVDPNAPPVTRTFNCYGTGHPVDEADTKRNHVATFFEKRASWPGQFVWHLFEVGASHNQTIDLNDVARARGSL